MKPGALLGLLCAVIALCLGQPAAAKKGEWLRADTHNFIIYTDGSQKQLGDFAVEVERFDALLRAMFDVPGAEKANRLTIFVLSNSSSVAKLAGDKSRTLAGFYSPRREGSFAVTNRERGAGKLDLSGQTVLFHEYSHHFMFRYFDYAYPPWYVEGFAEYLSTAEFDDQGMWSYGKPAFHRAYDLIAGADMPIETLLFGNPSQMSRAGRSAFYGRAWLFVHMLNSTPEYKEQLKRFLEMVGRGIEQRKAAVEAFGDLGELEKALDRYLKSSLSYRKGSTPLVYRSDIAITALDEVGSRLVELSLARLMGNDLPATRDALAGLAAKAPGNAAVQLELALAERDIAADSNPSDFGPAEQALDRAIAADGNLGRAHAFKALMMMYRLNDQGVDDPAEWKQVRDHIAIANRQDTEDPLPLLAYYESFLYEGRAVPDIAHEALAKAFSLVPEDKTTRVQYAFDLAKQQQYDKAIRLIEFLANDPHDAEQGKRLVAQLEAMRDGVPYLDTPALPVESEEEESAAP